ADVRSRALLQRLCESCRTRTGDFHARCSRCHTPVRFHAGRRADATGRGSHPGQAGRHAGRLLRAATAGASASLAAEHHLSLCRWLLCEEEIYSRLGGLWPTKKREEDRIKTWPIPRPLVSSFPAIACVCQWRGSPETALTPAGQSYRVSLRFRSGLKAGRYSDPAAPTGRAGYGG